MQNEVRTAIYNAMAVVFTPVFFALAKQTESLPYCILSFVSMPTNRDTGKQYEEVYFQYLLYGKSLAGIEAYKVTLDAALKEKGSYNFENFTIAGLHQTMHIRPAILENVWQVGSAFKLEIEPI